MLRELERSRGILDKLPLPLRSCWTAEAAVAEGHQPASRWQVQPFAGGHCGCGFQGIWGAGYEAELVNSGLAGHLLGF